MWPTFCEINCNKREILDYRLNATIQINHGVYATLGRRLRYVDIENIDYDIPLDVVTDTVSKNETVLEDIWDIWH